MKTQSRIHGNNNSDALASQRQKPEPKRPIKFQLSDQTKRKLKRQQLDQIGALLGFTPNNMRALHVLAWYNGDTVPEFLSEAACGAIRAVISDVRFSAKTDSLYERRVARKVLRVVLPELAQAVEI